MYDMNILKSTSILDNLISICSISSYSNVICVGGAHVHSLTHDVDTHTQLCSTCNIQVFLLFHSYKPTNPSDTQRGQTHLHEHRIHSHACPLCPTEYNMEHPLQPGQEIQSLVILCSLQLLTQHNASVLSVSSERQYPRKKLPHKVTFQCLFIVVMKRNKLQVCKIIHTSHTQLLLLQLHCYIHNYYYYSYIVSGNTHSYTTTTTTVIVSGNTYS